MFIGHNAIAFAAKRAAPGVPLSVLFLAVQMPDLVWPALVLTKMEQVVPVKGPNNFLSLNFVSYPYSHSLAGVAAQGILLGLLWLLFARAKSMIGFGMIFFATLSHWVLDWVTHLPDLPLSFNGGEGYGYGLWRNPQMTIAVEIGLLVLGVLLYATGTRSKGGGGAIALWTLFLVLLGSYLATAYGPAPTSWHQVAYMSLGGGLLLVLWAVWVDVSRASKRAEA